MNLSTTLLLDPHANLIPSKPSETSQPPPTLSTDMSTSPDNSRFETDLYPIELSDLLTDQDMVDRLTAATSYDPVSRLIIRHYEYVSQSIRQATDDLDRHYEERNALFRFAVHNERFTRMLRPIARIYRQNRRAQSHPYSRPTSRISTPSDNRSVEPPSNSSSDADDKDLPPPSQSVPITPARDGASSSLSYVTDANNNHDTPPPLLELPTPEPARAVCPHCHLPGHYRLECLFKPEKVVQGPWYQGVMELGQVGRTLQDMINEGLGDSSQNPIDVDRIHPDVTPQQTSSVRLPPRSDDSLAKAMGRNRRRPQ